MLSSKPNMRPVIMEEENPRFSTRCMMPTVYPKRVAETPPNQIINRRESFGGAQLEGVLNWDNPMILLPILAIVGAVCYLGGKVVKK